MPHAASLREWAGTSAENVLDPAACCPRPGRSGSVPKRSRRKDSPFELARVREATGLRMPPRLAGYGDWMRVCMSMVLYGLCVDSTNVSEAPASLMTV